MRPLSRRDTWPDVLRTQDGYAAVDALVALMILASTIVFALAAVHVGRQAADAALEARQSTQLLEEVLESAPGAPGESSARDRRFAWRLTVEEPVLVAGPAALCRHDATVTALATGRRYRLATARICPSGDPI